MYLLERWHSHSKNNLQRNEIMQYLQQTLWVFIIECLSKPNLHKENNVIMLIIGTWTSPQYNNMQISFFNYCNFCQFIYVSGTWRSQSKFVVGRNKGFDRKSNNNLKSSVNLLLRQKEQRKINMPSLDTQSLLPDYRLFFISNTMYTAHITQRKRKVHYWEKHLHNPWIDAAQQTVTKMSQYIPWFLNCIWF